MNLAELAGRVGPILGFLVCITIVAELSDGIGVFRMVAGKAARLAGGSVVALWLLVVLVAILSTAVLSLDTTAVLLTPVVLTLARQLDLDPGIFAYTAVWLANTASLFLPASNLTNLLAVTRLDTAGGDGSAPGFAVLLWPAAATSVAITAAALAVIFRRSLRGTYVRPGADRVADRGLLVLASLVCALLGPAFLLGVNVFLASGVAAAVLVVACAIRIPSLLAWQLVPWKVVVGVSILFVLVQLAHEHGLGAALGQAAGTGSGWAHLLRLTAIGALAANLFDNLPSYLALEPAASDSPVRLAALLIGVNAGPLLTPWASLATILWAARCRSAGVSVSWLRFGVRGLLLVPLVLLASVSALWLARA